MWMPSLESVREWHGKARYEVYDDPAYRRMPLEAMGALEATTRWRLFRFVASPKKRSEQAGLQLPPGVEALKRTLDGDGKRRDRENPLDRVKWRAMQRAIEVLCFLRAYGVVGLERWAIARLSPRHRITQLARERRALRLYRASRGAKR